MIFVGNRNNEVNDKTGTFVKELVSGLIGLVLYQVLMDFMIEEYPMDDLDWLDNFCQQTAFKLDWKWMIK